MHLREKSLEVSSMFLAAELLERDRSVHMDHVNRIRQVAARMSIEIEEERLLRSEIEGNGKRSPPGEYFLVGAGLVDKFRLADVAPERLASSPPPDSVVLKRYLELDRCLE